MVIMKFHHFLVILAIILFSFPNVYSVNPQIYYKSIYLIGSNVYVDNLITILKDIMIIDSNVKKFERIKSKNDLIGVDIIIYVPDHNRIDDRELQLISEWILLGGKLLMVFAPNSTDYISNTNQLLSSVGSSIRYKSVDVDQALNLTFNIDGIVNEYQFDPGIYSVRLSIDINSEIYVIKDDVKLGSGGFIYILGQESPWILMEYLEAYSDLFTWYYSKVITLAFSADEVRRTEEFKLLFIELLSWGITPYLNPNIFSVGLTILTGVAAVAAYTSVKLLK